jgi:ankyrin repeat protein
MDGWLPIHYASAAGHADIVQALLAAGSDVEEPAADGDAPLHKAAIAGHLAAVQLLKTRSQVRSLPVVVFHMPLPPVQKCAMPSAMCCSVFQLSSLPCPALLLQLDQRNSAGSTPLYNASSQGHLAVMRELAEEGATGKPRLLSCPADAASQPACQPPPTPILQAVRGKPCGCKPRYAV